MSESTPSQAEGERDDEEEPESAEAPSEVPPTPSQAEGEDPDRE